MSHALPWPRLTAAALLALALAGAPGCKSDCQVVCETLKACYFSNLDVQDCTDDCADRAAQDEGYAETVAECAECAGPRECSELGACFNDCL